MILYPNCKINLGLRVVRKREDGYHDLETVFVPVYNLHDELEVSVYEKTDTEKPLNDRLVFIQEGIAVDCKPEDNLIIKCYRLMASRYPQIKPVTIRFRKNIPFGAGLGGGSSDAAHMAIALNKLFGLGLSKEELVAEVQPLGADCPFFIYNTPCYAEGIGDKLTPVKLDLTGLRIIMVKPTEGVSTKEAYAGILENRMQNPDFRQKISIKEAIRNLAEGQSALCLQTGPFTNDFEETVFPLHPNIANIKKRLLDAGALYASMSGSGSTVFGLFKDDAESRTYTKLRLFKQEFASMILLDDSFGEWKA